MQKTVILGITRAKKGFAEKYFVSFCPKMWFEIAMFRIAAISNFIFWVAKFQKYFDSIKVIIVVYHARYFHAFIQMKFWLLSRYDLSNNMHVEYFLFENGWISFKFHDFSCFGTCQCEFIHWIFILNHFQDIFEHSEGFRDLLGWFKRQGLAKLGRYWSRARFLFIR